MMPMLCQFWLPDAAVGVAVGTLFAVACTDCMEHDGEFKQATSVSYVVLAALVCRHCIHDHMHR